VGGKISRVAADLVSLLFLKNRRNIHELPAMLDLAAELGADEVIASNLTFIAKPGFESHKAYSLQASSPIHCRKSVLAVTKHWGSDISLMSASSTTLHLGSFIKNDFWLKCG
jgi:flagellar basal body rod protein FlgF